MSPTDATTLVVPALIFACGMAFLSYRVFDAYRRWSLRGVGYWVHLPGILGIALMVIAILFASSLGWPHVIVAVLGGAAVAYLYVYVFRMRVGAALLGPVLVVALIFLMPRGFWA